MSVVYAVSYWNFTKDEGSLFHVFAYDFDDAREEAVAYIVSIMEKDDKWDIVRIEMLPEINIVNYADDESDEQPAYEGDGACPYCAADDCDPDLLIKFACPRCEQEIVVSDNGWKALYCKGCGNRMERIDFKFVDGTYIYEEQKEDKI